MPEQPPTAGGVRKRSIVGVLAKEMATAATVGSTGRWGRVKKRLGKINLDEVPARPEGALGTIGDEEETVVQKVDGSGQRGSSERRARNAAAGGWGAREGEGPSGSAMSVCWKRGGWSVGKEDLNHMLLCNNDIRCIKWCLH
jgi:hypothetical protein